MKVLGYYWPVLWLILKPGHSIHLLSRSRSKKCAGETTTISVGVAQRPRSVRDFCSGQKRPGPVGTRRKGEKPSEGPKAASWHLYCDPLPRVTRESDGDSG